MAQARNEDWNENNLEESNGRRAEKTLKAAPNKSGAGSGDQTLHHNRNSCKITTVTGCCLDHWGVSMFFKLKLFLLV